PIRSLLMIPLVYRQQLQGYLSIFRNAADSTDLELAQKIGRQFAIALYERALSQQLHVSSDAQSTEAQLSTHQLLRVSQQQVGLSEMLAQLQTATDLTTFARATTKGICQLLAAERVSVYRFNDDWGGEYIHEFEYAKPEWIRTAKLGENTAWNDTFLQETQGGRYRNNETYVVDDIHQAGLASCHIDMLKQFEVQSFSTAPIFVNGQLWGVLAAYQHSAPRHWPTTDVFFLHQSATFLGLAFQSMPDDSLTGVQQQTQLERVIQQQTGLCGVLTQLQTAPDLTTIVRATTKEICDLIETERVAIYQFNDDWSGEFIHDYEYTTPEWQHPLKLGAETVWADTYIQETQGGRYRNNETYILDDIYQAGLSACFINVLEQFRVNALATAPIFVGNKLWGVLAAYHHSEPRHWSTADVLLLKQAATALGLALQHVPDSAHFTESEQQSQLERVEQHQSSLCEILTKLQTTTDLARIFRSTTKEICGSLGAERVSVYRFNENWGGAYIHDFEYAKAKWQRPFKLGTNTVWNDTYLQDTQGGRYRYNETYAVDDIHQAELSSCHVDILKQFEVQSFATAPVFVDEQLWGVIAAYQHSGPRHWSPTDVSFLHQVATALGLALYQDGLRSKAKAGRSGFDVSAAERGAWEESVAKLTYTDREG
ncbi:MAG: GAF domain-containing protein, partial [Cyanobacteria bacterium P01_D01_bin.44]